MRTIVAIERCTYAPTCEKSREARAGGLAWMGTYATVMPLRPAWMIVSTVYVNFEKTCRRNAASRR